MRFIFLFVVIALFIFLCPFPISRQEVAKPQKPEKPVAILKAVTTAYYTPLENQADYAAGSREDDEKLNGNGITYTGEKAARGIAAADPNVFPLGTILWIPQYGYIKIADIGGNIKGSRIDLFMGDGEEALKEALRWGIRYTEVHVVKWGGK